MIGSSLEQFTRDTLCTGAIATAATTLAASALGKLEDDNAIAPINSVSHIAWGDKAAAQEQASVKYTLTGGLLNSAAVISWAAVHTLLFGRRNRPSATEALVGGATVSALAYVTDYHVVPSRLTPGFEKRLSNRSLFAVYGCLAAALAMGALASGKRAE